MISAIFEARAHRNSCGFDCHTKRTGNFIGTDLGLVERTLTYIGNAKRT